jgi:hypothetical protein
MVYTTIDLPELVKEAQNKNKNSMTYIIEAFKPKLQASLHQTVVQERENLAQELSIKLIEAIQHYNLEATPGFYDFLDQIEGSSRRS